MTRRQLIIAHILYWLYFFVLMEFISKLAYQHQIINFSILITPLALSNYLIFAAFFYFNYLWVLPTFLENKRYLSTLAAWMLLGLLFVGVRYWIQEYLLYIYFGICNYCDGKKAIYFVNNFFQGFQSIIFAGTLIRFINRWLRTEKQKLALQHEKLSAERALLQSQVNPHFLFNTLNNIYSMMVNGSPLALKAILKLSEIMRYASRAAQSNWMDLDTELVYLESYIALQSFRVKEPSICYDKIGRTKAKRIPPMLLISFVENAFKHGVLNDAECPVHIKLEVNSTQISFTVRNRVTDHFKDSSSGIGVENVRRRLEFYYGENFDLSLNRQKDLFISRLILKEHDTMHHC